MHISHLFRPVACLFLATIVVLPGNAQNNQDNKLKFSADFRFRTEIDRDSRQSSGDLRDDRDRMRFRARFGLVYQRTENISFGLRVRSGHPDATQSPHVTLGSELTPKSFSLDKAFVRVAAESGSFWLGKNSFPFWKQNEHFWDDDATPEGAAGTYSFSLGDQSSATATAGLFILDEPTSNTFSDQAKLIAGQLALKTKVNDVSAQGAAGLFVFRENPNEPDPRLQDLDYDVLVIGAKVGANVGSVPGEIGADVMLNLKDYPTTLFNHDQTTGFIVGVKLGNLSSAKDWLLAYYYAAIQKYAVVARYAQDDWVRWGSSTATRSSNFAGHEIRAALALGSKNNIVARLYIVEGLELESASAVAKEDGIRFRIDWNIGI